MSIYHGLEPALTGGVAVADTVVSPSSTWSSQKILEEIAAGQGIRDDEMSDTSENAVQNKVITAAIAKAILDAKAYTNQEIGKVLQFNVVAVQTLSDVPEEERTPHTIYLTPQGTGTNQSIEWLWVLTTSGDPPVTTGRWEQIGTTNIDLSNYPTRTDLTNALADYVKSVDFAQLVKDNTEDALSDTSISPVQNKVVKAALDGKADKATTLSGYGITDGVSNSDFIQYQEEVSNKPMIYGVMWTGSKKTKLTRIDDAAGLDDPVPYYSGMTEEYGSPFDTIMPWAGMERVTDAEAGELVKIPKFYYKFTQDGKVLKLQISNSKVAGFSVSPAHMDRGDGKGERDYVYIGRYHCAASTYKSTTGVKPQVNITRSAARTAIHNLGTTIWQSDFAMRLTIWMLYLVEFANWDSQSTIGGGCSQTTSSSSTVFNMGNTDSMPYHTGTVSNSHSTYGVCQYRWIEGLWDNCYDWMDGCYYSSSGMSVILNPANFSDTANGTVIGTPISGYPSALSVSTAVFPMFYPTTSGGSTTTYIPDYWSFDASSACLRCGGGYDQGLGLGLFYVDYNGATDAGGGIGCRLQKLP